MSVPTINLAETPDFDLGGLRVSPARRQVCKGGECRELEPKVAQVLIALASASPAVVSRDRLIEQCWDGRIVGDDALNRCILALRHLAREFSPEPFAIETVPRVGYSLVAGPGRTTAGNGPRSSPRRKLALALIAALLVVSAAAAYWLLVGRSETEPASIAVLPFRNLSSGDPYFAEGVGEEILDQLAREPGFRVAGRASAAQFTGNPNPREVGRKLGVDYILEGSVRSDAGQVRVSASLVKTSDGMLLWSETYDRRLEDILEIQSAIGQAVANGLKRRLVHSPVRGVRGDAYALYLNARGLMRSANPQSGQEAVSLLQQAIRLDPNFAPAWASLAEALLLEGRTKGPDGMIAILPRAHQAARRALQLDPNLADAHSVMGELLGTETPEAISHLRRAAELDPGSAEAQISGAIAQEVSGDYAAALAGLRRARALDPLSPLPVRSLIGVATVMGERGEAEMAAKRGFPDEPMTQEYALARIAWYSGDVSEAVRRWSMLAADPGLRWARPSRISLEDAQYALKLSPHRPSTPPFPTVGSARFGPIARVWMTSAPSPEEWRKHNRSLGASLVHHDENIVAAKMMLRAGRMRELAATYDSPSGLLSLRRGQGIGPCQLDEAAIVALTLQASGRPEEASVLLRRADALIQRIYSRGKVPIWFEEDAAGIWAVQGKHAAALEALDRALRRGWVHIGRTDLPNIEDEPAFQSLRGNSRFKAVIAGYRAHYAKERQETARALKNQA